MDIHWMVDFKNQWYLVDGRGKTLSYIDTRTNTATLILSWDGVCDFDVIVQYQSCSDEVLNDIREAMLWHLGGSCDADY